MADARRVPPVAHTHSEREGCSPFGRFPIRLVDRLLDLLAAEPDDDTHGLAVIGSRLRADAVTAPGDSCLTLPRSVSWVDAPDPRTMMHSLGRRHMAEHRGLFHA